MENQKPLLGDKPIGRKAYGSIGHIIGSRLGPNDYSVGQHQTNICTINPGYRTVYVQPKIDGTCVAIHRTEDALIALQRKGWSAASSPLEMHRMFDRWVQNHSDWFLNALLPGERIVGEWLAVAHGTIYSGLTEQNVFTAFDIMVESDRLPLVDFYSRLEKTPISTVDYIQLSPADFQDGLAKPEELLYLVDHMGAESPEGLMYRVHHKKTNELLFLAKYVCPDKIDGKYLANISGQSEVWNWHE